METQIMMPSPAVDFNFDSNKTTPYTTAPSTPQRFPSFFYSVPTTPTHSHDDDDTDFAFDFSGHLEPPSFSAADELFHCGKIKPLKPVSTDPPTSEPFSPRCKKKEFEAFSLASKQTPCNQTQTTQKPSKRGRETTATSAAARGKVSRSSSPFRISDVLWGEEKNSGNQSWYNRWKLKDLLLFRSASEGSKGRLGKYSRIRKGEEDVKNSSFRSTDSLGGSSRRKVSAHEIHYTANRAVAEEMRKKTFLPYKSGLLGCLGFHNNGGSVHEISRGINSVIKQRN